MATSMKTPEGSTFVPFMDVCEYFSTCFLFFEEICKNFRQISSLCNYGKNVTHIMLCVENLR